MLYLNVFFAGFLILLTPGPVFIANLSLISNEGRLKGLQLMLGALIGDALWFFLVCLSFVQANLLSPIVFNALGIACGSYIIYLAYRIYKSAQSNNAVPMFKRPFVDGLMLGILHPKSYIAFLAIFSVMVFNHISDVTWQDLPAIFASGLAGFIAAYGVVLLFAGFKPVKNFYKKNFKILSYLFSIIFVYFGLLLIWNALSSSL